ncbi:MAG TPA: transcriptional regulator [Polyangia bacterium]|nr:transcriptional regulator [Polyangia bacterium]
MNIKPIKTTKDYEASLREVSRLWRAKVGSPDGDRLDVLITLVHAYEQEHYPIDPPDPIEAIEFRLEQGGLTREALVKLFGRSRTSEILGRKRQLSLSQIRKLHHLGIPAEVLIAEPRRRQRRHRKSA